MTTTVARLLADSLEAHDVDQIFCVPGESYVGLTSVLTERNSIRMIVCRHEGGAGFMAVADGRLRNRAGVCIVSRGPGLSNAHGLAALRVPRRDADGDAGGPGGAQGFRPRARCRNRTTRKLLSDITKCVIEVNEPEQASEAIARAFHLAESGTPGPVAVILPEDIFDEETDAELNLPRPRVLAGPRAEDLDQLADMLAKAERPLVLVGGALLADALHDKAVVRRPAQAGRGLGAADLARRIAGRNCSTRAHPNYGGYMGIRVPAGPDRRDEERRSDRVAGRAADRHRQPVLHASPPRRSRNCRWCMSGRTPNEIGRVWRADLGIPADPHEVIKGLLATRRAGGCRRSARGWVAGLHAHPSQAAGRRSGSRPPTASTSPPSCARWTSIWRTTRR